mgnify:CR=1 FL=1
MPPLDNQNPMVNHGSINLDELERLEKLAVPAGWFHEERRGGIYGPPAIGGRKRLMGVAGADQEASTTGKFIVALRNAAPELIAAAREIERHTSSEALSTGGGCFAGGVGITRLVFDLALGDSRRLKHSKKYGPMGPEGECRAS